MRKIILFSCLMLFLMMPVSEASILVRNGCQGPPVYEVQTLLIEQGYLDGLADGICGPDTESAILRFQEDYGLDADGICGDGTYYYLSGGGTYTGAPCTVEGQIEGTPLSVTATGYTAYDDGCNEITYTGTYLHHGIIATDPDVIPLGTHVYIPGYGNAVAEDIGEDIRGTRIDLAFDSQEDAWNFGRQDIVIYILD